MDEDKDKKKEENKKPEESTPDTGTGDKPKESTLVDDTNLAAKRMEVATEAAKKERLEAEVSYAKMKLGGDSEAGSQPEPKKRLSDTEYAEALEKGLVDPLKEDGFR